MKEKVDVQLAKSVIIEYIHVFMNTVQIWRGQIKTNVNTILLLKTMPASPSCIDLIHINTNCYLETNVLCLNLIQNESKVTYTENLYKDK